LGLINSTLTGTHTAIQLQPKMPVIPRLILHQEAATLLCRERSNSDDEIQPLTSRVYIEMGCDDDNSVSSNEESIVSDDSSTTSKATTGPSLSLSYPAHADIEAQKVHIEPQVSPLGASLPTSNGSLFYSTDEVYAFGKTKIVVENTMKGAETVAKKTMKGAERVAKETVKRTGQVAKQTVKRTGNVAKRTGKVAKKTAKETEKVVKKTANAAVGLPHEASSHWSHLTLIVLLQAFGPVILSMPTPLTMLQSVNAGLSHNRGFLYGTHTLLDLFILSPFVSTCHYAIMDAKIPLEARAMAVLVGLSVGKLALAFIGEAWWSRNAQTVFPIPFSFIVTLVISLPFSMWTLWLMTPMRNDPLKGEKIRAKFKLCFGTLAAYMLSLLAACGWAAGFRALIAKPWLQSAYVLSIQLIEFLFKILVAANLTTRLNAQRWLQLNLVVDLLFASVQTAMLPYFANWASVTISVVGTMLTISWRSYAGVDRLQQFLPKARQVVESSSGPAAAFRGIGGLAHQMTISPVKEIAPMSTRLIGNGGTSPEWDEDKDEKPLDIEAKEIERSSTDDTESLSESESSDPQATKKREHCTHKTEEPKIDRRQAFRNQKSQPIRNSVLEEVTEEQRHLYHIVDSVSSAVLITVVRLAAIITSVAIRSLPIASQHLNASFQISDDQWRDAILYGMAFIGGVVLVLMGVGVYLLKGAELGGLTLNRVISYMFRDSFWFFFFWFCITQHLSIALQLNHFGADFTLKFEWLACREEGLMEWPGCVAMEPSM